jgi:hypothetical protein
LAVQDVQAVQSLRSVQNVLNELNGLNDLNLQRSHAKYANVRVREKTIEGKPHAQKNHPASFLLDALGSSLSSSGAAANEDPSNRIPWWYLLFG